MSKIQVKPTHYFIESYDTKERFISYWHQIDEIRKLNPTSVLEIGVGNKFVSNFLKERNVKITTMDFDKELQPDVVGDILDMPFKDNSFDVTACFEVLEHIPYEKFELAIKEIYRVTKNYALISLPDYNPYNTLILKIPPFINIELLIKGFKMKSTKHKFDGQHYWEIGKENYELSKILDVFDKSKFSLVHTYNLIEHSYHRFFLLKK